MVKTTYLGDIRCLSGCHFSLYYFFFYGRKIRNENTNDEKLENSGVVVKMKISEKDIVKQVKNVLSTKDLHYEDDENAFNHRNEKNQSEMKRIQERYRFNGQSNFDNPLLVSISCPNSY